MAFGRSQELTKDDLIKAGLNPDDLTDLKANGVKKADLETLKTELAASMNTSVTELIKNQFTELETRLRTPVKREEVIDDKDKPDEQTEFLTDPVAYINKRTSQGVAFTAITATKMRMDLALDRAKTTLRGFRNNALKDEIIAEWVKYKPENMAMNKDFDPDQLLKKVHDSVIGSHMEEIEHDTAKKEGKFNMVASGSSSGGGNRTAVINDDNSGKKPEELLTEVELDLAKKYGMTPKEWADSQASWEKDHEVAKAGA